MKPLLLALGLLALYGCAAHNAKPMSPKTVVVLGNQTAPAVCDHADADAQRARAERWKAYAETLETQLGIPHEKEPE